MELVRGMLSFCPPPRLCLTAERERGGSDQEREGAEVFLNRGSELHCSNWALAQPTDGGGGRPRREEGGDHTERYVGSGVGGGGSRTRKQKMSGSRKYVGKEEMLMLTSVKSDTKV